MHPTSIKGCFPNSFKSGTCPNQGKEGEGGGVWNAAAPNFLLDKFSSRFQGGGERVKRAMDVQFPISYTNLYSKFHGGRVIKRSGMILPSTISS